MIDKACLLQKMIAKPLKFNDNDFNKLIESYKIIDDKCEVVNVYYDTQTAFKDFRECFKKLYDLNEENLKEASNTKKGSIGWFNKKVSAVRKDKFYKRLEKLSNKILETSDNNKKNYILIYAEGDSWFQFINKDVIDWLCENENYLVYTDAFAGDWISNIIYEEQYVDGISTFIPDVFLIGGGGNDLVGHNRLAMMVENCRDYKIKDDDDIGKLKFKNKKYTSIKDITTKTENDDIKKQILSVDKLIHEKFFAFLWLMRAQYTMILKGIYLNTKKFENMITLLHGYAYPYPGHAMDWKDIFKEGQVLINKLLGNGKWLYKPLLLKGYVDPKIQRSIVVYLIYKFNQMLSKVAEKINEEIKKNKEILKKFPGDTGDRVFHIDCRNIPQSKEDWFDELHLKSEKFKEVAGLMKEQINNFFFGNP
jgi:hypothetical protein